MEQSLFSFIWKYSKRQQLILLAMTLVTFPFIFLSLELPKRIINDVIGAADSLTDPWTRNLSQQEFLLVLCLAFLAAVLIAGMLKMALNIQKGILSERMLRRLRYMLIARMMRFPAPYFRSTGQGEMVAMITSEAEPMGGLMGDAVAQPVFLAGQMLTIVTFLFLQSFWFGVVSVALIPLQAWLIPMLQRRINRLHKSRIRELRGLATEIGETAGGLSDLRENGGLRYRRAVISHRLGALFGIRKRIYMLKFFMKFLNNLIGQVTPFVYYLAGGLLALRGDLSVGALVAALAAYKDLSSPWRELLTYYNLVQDMSARWKIMAERFAPAGMISADLIEGGPDHVPSLHGDIQFDGVTVLDGDGQAVLEDLSFTLPAGARVAVQCATAAERAAFAQLLTREVLPARGRITVAGHSLDRLHQGVIAARIGHAHSRPYLFDGTLGDNVMMPLKTVPQAGAALPPKAAKEALRSGNSIDPLEAQWSNPLVAPRPAEEVRSWWFQIAGAMGLGGRMFRRALHSNIDPARHPELASGLLALRPQIRDRLAEEGLEEAVLWLDRDRFHSALPLAENLLFALPIAPFTDEELAASSPVQAALDTAKLAGPAYDAGLAVAGRLGLTFGSGGAAHPLFARLGLEAAEFDGLVALADRLGRADEPQPTKEERARIIAVLFRLGEVQLGADLPEDFKAAILTARKAFSDQWLAALGDRFTPLSPTVCMSQLSVLENALFAKLAPGGADVQHRIEDIVMQALETVGLKQALALTLYDLPTGLGGSKLAPVLQERAALSRAAIKEPDILLLDQIMVSQEEASRQDLRGRLAAVLPAATMIFLESSFENPDRYDVALAIENGRLQGLPPPVPQEGQADDFAEKLSAISSAELFSAIGRRNQRLLAFAASWQEVGADARLYSHDEKAEAVYLCHTGEVALYWPGQGGTEQPVTWVGPGQLVGELAVILEGTYRMDCISRQPGRLLRIAAGDFRDVISGDVAAAMGLLQTTARRLGSAADAVRDAGPGAAKDKVDDNAR